MAVDDAFQNVSEVVRGGDLLGSTGRQVYLQSRLNLPTPTYAHHPVAVDEDGRKLSKRFRADPVAALPPEQALKAALNFLGQRCPGELSLEATWDWALANWKLSRIPRRLQLPLHPVEAGAD